MTLRLIRLKVTPAFAASASLILSYAASAFPVLQNSSFESFSGDSTWPFTDIIDVASVPGWSARNILNRIDIFTGPGYNGSDGIAALRLHVNTDQIFQIVHGFSPGATYSLSFYIAPEGVWNDEGDFWSNTANNGQGVEVLVNGIAIGEHSVSAFDLSSSFLGNPFSYTLATIQFVASAETQEIQFNVLDSWDDGGVVLDSLTINSIDDPIPNPVPSPTPLTLLVLGLGVYALAPKRAPRMRGRKAQAAVKPKSQPA